MTYTELEAEYIAFQLATRRETGQDLLTYFGGVLIIDSVSDAPVGSFKDFRFLILDFPSQIGFCKAFCLHQASVNAYERYLIKSMPSQIRRGLIESELLDSGLINWLDELGQINYGARYELDEAS